MEELQGKNGFVLYAVMFTKEILPPKDVPSAKFPEASSQKQAQVK